VKPILAASSLIALLFLVPAATADFSVLNGTVVIHTDGDPGLSALGSPLARVDPEATCDLFYLYSSSCTLVYGNPAGLAEYGVWVHDGPCVDWETCVVVGVETGEVRRHVYVLADEDPIGVTVCVGDCVLVDTDPICIYVSVVGDIVCET
jgi:hypothetical protein